MARNREYFTHKLQAEKQSNHVLHTVEGSAAYDFLLVDTRGREAFAQGHIPGASYIGAAESEENMGPAAARFGDCGLLLESRLTAVAKKWLCGSRLLAKELNVGWKEWTYNRHPTHQGKADISGIRCSCSK